MAVDLRWLDAYSASWGAFTAQEKAAGWPESMTPVQLARIQRPVADENCGVAMRVNHQQDRFPFTEYRTPARTAQDVLLYALGAACKSGALACTAIVNRYKDKNRVAGIVLLPGGKARGGDRNIIEETIYRVTASSFATWLHAQGEAPSKHAAAWFEVRGVAWPPVAEAGSSEPTDWAGMVESFKNRRKGATWSDAERTILQVEFSKRCGWKRADDGTTWIKDSGVQKAMAKELKGMGRSSLDRHLGDGPNQSAAAFTDMANAFTGTR